MNTRINIPAIRSIEKRNIFLLVVVYIVGMVGTNFDLHEQFWTLTPVNLLFSLIMVLQAHEHWNNNFVVFAIVCFSTGFLFELIGVHTGLIFGTYAYGETLGFKVGGVPLTIGVNWLMLVYSSACVANALFRNPIVKAIFGAALMVLLDFLIEPVAMAYDFWDWENGIIPIQNYVAWFLIALFLHSLFQWKFDSTQNRVGWVLMGLQFLFFALLLF
ncbi:MAG: carotenoid biosynthesis protein [Bacteroidota bacterium]